MVLVEFLPKILSSLDPDIRRAVIAQLARVGVQVFTNSTVEFIRIPPADAISENGNFDSILELSIVSRHDQSATRVLCDAYMAATGRRGNSDLLQVEKVGIVRNNSNCIQVHSRSMWTGVAKIYAVGDVAGPSAFAPHGLVTSGQAQAIRSVYSAFVNEWPSSELRSDYFEHIPVAVWLTPDVAYVGLTENEAVQRYGSPNVGTSRAEYSSTVKYCIEPREGFVKLVYLLDGGQIVGAHLFGTDASEMIHYGAVLVNCHHTVFDVVKEVMAGVTYQEAYRTAGLAASKQASAHLAKIKSSL